MTYRDILVLTDNAVDARFRAEAAASIARRSGAHLTGVFARSDYLRTYFAGDSLGYATAIDLDALIADHEAATALRSEEARAVFEAAAAQESVASDWLIISGDDNTALTKRARRADLTVMAPQTRTVLGSHDIAAAAIGMACGGPILVLPAGSPGERILIAWKDARESARALHDAWPMILAAQEVHVLTIGAEEDEADGQLQRLFEHHGCKANLIVDRHSRGPPATSFASRCRPLARICWSWGSMGVLDFRSSFSAALRT